MIALVCVFTLFFWHLNRQQKHKGKLIHNMVCLASEALIRFSVLIKNCRSDSAILTNYYFWLYTARPY